MQVQEGVVAISYAAVAVNKFRPTGHQGRSRRQNVIFSILLILAGFTWLVGTCAESAWASVGAPRAMEPLSKTAIISLTNNARMNQGLTTLEESPLLDAVAETRARDLLDKQYFGHVSPTGEEASHVARRVGYRYKIIAENLASGAFFANDKVVDCWMGSPGHRRNILSAQVREIGVSVLRGRLNGTETWVSVQIFGLRTTAREGALAFSLREPTVQIGGDDLAAETCGEKLRRMKGEIDAERHLIQSDQRIPSNDPRRNEELALRIRAYNEKANRYNQALADTKTLTLAMDARDE